MDTERFWSRVDKSGECWLWTGPRDRQGYGSFFDGTRPRGAHRVSYELAHGPIPAKHFVCHVCDNPSCVKPDHLFAGTVKENARDMVAKGRIPRGDQHWTQRKKIAATIATD